MEEHANAVIVLSFWVSRARECRTAACRPHYAFIDLGENASVLVPSDPTRLLAAAIPCWNACRGAMILPVIKAIIIAAFDVTLVLMGATAEP